MEKFVKSVVMESLEFPVITYKDGKYFVSEVPIINVASQGKSVEESVKNLKEAVELYFEGEDIKEVLKDKLPLPGSVFTSTLIFNLKKRQVSGLPIPVVS